MECAVSRPLPLTGTHNTRDLGGYPLPGGGRTRAGAYLRSDAFTALTGADERLLRDYGLRLVVDLRARLEIDAAPGPLRTLPGIRHLCFPLLDAVQSSGMRGPMPGSMGELYCALLDAARPTFGALFGAMAAQEGCILFHCTAGKDRTGVTAMLLLQLAGVPDEAAVADYAASDRLMAPVLEAQRRRMRAQGIEVPSHLLRAGAPDMERALRHLHARYGDARAYLGGCGVPQEALDRLARRLAG